MSRKNWLRLMAVLVAFGLIAAACGDDDSAEPAEEPATTDEPAEEPGEEPADAGGDLSAVCPSPLVIQTDWFPESEHGAMYQMIGDDYTVDTDNKVVSGSLVAGGADTGIDIEVRTGGPAIGFAPVSSHMYTDDSIHLGYGTTDALILQRDSAPLFSVVAPLERNPQIIMWDPETYPNVSSIADLGTEGVTVNVFAGGEFPGVFVAQGIWSADQVDPSYDGSPARFVAEGGAIAQQGFASAEPHNYENVYEEWMKPVAFELLHDAGYQVYSQTIAIREGDLEEMRPCLEQIVPIIQQSSVDFVTDPDRANGIIIDAVAQYEDFWVYDQALADFSVATQIELGLVSNGPDDILGNQEEARYQSVIDALIGAGLDVPDGLQPSDLFTNEFIDESIGLPAGFGGTTDGDEQATVDLSGVCPSPLVIQTDWFPESEHGAMYQMIGDDYTVDTNNKVVSGSLVAGGADTGIDIEVRTGGPAIGFAPVSSHMYTDDSIHMGYGTTDALILQNADAPLFSVVAPLEKNPQIIMWDPATYPNVSSIADLGTEGITVNVFGGGVFSEVFVAQGIWSADQVDPSYDGSPARFVAEGGAIAQQGFASAEPHNYENVFEEWMKPVAFELLHDAGYELYSQTVAIRPSDLEEMRPCLEQIVPIIQQSSVDFVNDPARANGIIIDAVAQYEDFWVYDEALAAFSVAKQIELGLVSNGPDDILGNMEEARIQKVIDDIRAAGLDVPEDLVASDLFTNEFIDESIGL